MDTWTRIEHAGFYPKLAARALRRALGGEEPLATVCQLDAAFDRGSMFRHLTIASLTRSVLVHLHIDELEDGRAGVATGIYSIDQIRAMSTFEAVESPEVLGTDEKVTELSVSIDMGGIRRTDIEPLQCDDPQCLGDHGYSAQTVPDDLSLRISAAADGEDVLAEAKHFVNELTALVGTHHGH
ncbi:DUF5998 family protein [Schaalia sp. ZJ1691]|uniref:DUF5998 family protein n=1 Tax=Schaalia sp. ZJ1691 TaxID=2709404 RepID=UPI0013EA0687|nr:DUF5998 family protein [Schaalia sp. ZJ1691]